MAGERFYIVDAFTKGDEPFTGNPAAVCLTAPSMDEARMRSLAAEFNLSETAFVEELKNVYGLRWFTPTVEVDLCGHATLASAHVLFTAGLAEPDEDILFETRSGRLRARARSGLIEMDFPPGPAVEAASPEGLAGALGADILWCGRNGSDYLVELASAGEVRGLSPDFRALGRIPARGFIVTAPSDDQAFDFVSRFFAPSAGIDEDPVTGSAHTALGPYWAERLGRTALTGFQASKRGGVVGVEVSGERVLLSGRVVTVARGELL